MRGDVLVGVEVGGELGGGVGDAEGELVVVEGVPFEVVVRVHDGFAGGVVPGYEAVQLREGRELAVVGAGRGGVGHDAGVVVGGCWVGGSC